MKAGHVRSPVSGRDVKTGQVWRPVSGENFVSGRPLVPMSVLGLEDFGDKKDRVLT